MRADDDRGLASPRERSDRVVSGPVLGARVPYAPLCAALGLVLGWLPRAIHGPHPYKFTVLYIKGSIVVWAFYTARLLVGFLVGITRWPSPWYLRGPLCGFVMLLPVSLIALATPGCGWV